MIKGIVFDLDHTLFDRYATIRAVAPFMYKKFKDRLAYGINAEDVAEKIIDADEKYICFGFDAVTDYLNKVGLFRENVATEEYKDMIFHCFSKKAVSYPFTYSVLQKLKSNGYKIGLITNGSHELQYKKLQMLDIEKYFDEIVVSGDVGVHKPALKPFEIMAERIGLPPTELMYVGDHPINDVNASRNAGYTPVWVKTRKEWQFPHIKRCDLEIDSIEEIFKIL